MISLLAVLLATVTGNPPPASYTCTTTATIFTIPFPYLAPGDLKVTTSTVAGVLQSTLILGSGYSVKPSVAPSTGTMTLTAPCTAGSVLTITRNMALTQPQSFRTGSYQGAPHEQAFDRLAMEIQQNAATHSTDKTAQAAKDAAQDVSISGVSASVAGLNSSSQAVTSASSVLAFGSSTPRTLTSRFADVTNVRDYGLSGNGSADDTTAFNAAATAAVTAGSGTLFVPTPFLTINGVANAKNLRIVCNGTTIQGTTGQIDDHDEMINCTRRGFNTSQPVFSGKPALNHRYPTAVFLNTSTQAFVFVSKEGNSPQKYALFSMLYNSFTTGQSEAVNAQTWRLGQVTDVGVAYVMFQGSPTLSGTWTPTTPSATALGLNTSGGPTAVPNFWAATVNGAYLEWANVPGPLISVGSFTSLTGSLMTVSIDGVNVGTFTNNAAVASNVITFRALTSSGLHTVRVTHSGSAGQNAYVFGLNFFELRDAVPGLAYDKWWYGRDGTTYANFIKDDGGQEYAFLNRDTNTFAGGYHGGETTVVAPSWKLDGVATTFAVNDLKVAQVVTIDQNTNINWATRVNDTVVLRSQMTFYDSGIGFVAEAHAVNGVNLLRSFTNLTKTNPVFSQITYPIAIDATNTSDPHYNAATAYFSLGRTNKVIQREPATGRTVTTWFTMQPVESSVHGGTIVWKVDAQYYKVYYAPAFDENHKFTSLAWESVWLFN